MRSAGMRFSIQPSKNLGEAFRFAKCAVCSRLPLSPEKPLESSCDGLTMRG